MSNHVESALECSQLDVLIPKMCDIFRSTQSIQCVRTCCIMLTYNSREPLRLYLPMRKWYNLFDWSLISTVCVETVSNSCRIVSKLVVYCRVVDHRCVKLCSLDAWNSGPKEFLGDELLACALVIVEISESTHPRIVWHVYSPNSDFVKMRACARIL